MAVEAVLPRAPYAADPAPEPRSAPSGADEPDPQRLPPRLRPHHPFDRVPAARLQDPGVRLPRGRPLPHPADPHAGSRPRSPARSPARSASTRTWPRRWRSATTSAIRRSATPASARSTAASPTTAASTTTPRRSRVVTAARAPLRRLRRAQPDLGDARRPGQAQRPAHRSRRPARSALTRATALPPAIPDYRRAAGSRAVELSPAPRRRLAAIADDIAYDAHDIDDGLRAGLFTLDDLAELPLVGDVLARASAHAVFQSRRRRGSRTNWSGG